MEYKLLADPRIKQDAQRCLRPYHEAYRRRRQAALSSSRFPLSNTSSTTPHGSCWRFYRGEAPASPGREHVDDLLAYGGESSTGRVLKSWFPEELEYRHDYIQWLFPLRERGVNWLAPLLTTAEADAMQQDGLIMARILQALRMMLRFYGTDIAYAAPRATTSKDSQESSYASPVLPSSTVRLEAQLRRTSNPTEWVAQYDNLVHRSHNHLRISRILQFLGEVGLEPLKLGWLRYLAQEVMSEVSSTQAPLAACRGSFFFWMETPYEEKDRVQLQKLVETLASRSAPPSPPTGPVVVVEGLLLPSTLHLPRVLNSDTASTSASVEGGAKKRVRPRE